MPPQPTDRAQGGGYVTRIMNLNNLFNMSKGGNQGGSNKGGGSSRPAYPANKPSNTPGQSSGGGRSNAPAKK